MPACGWCLLAALSLRDNYATQFNLSEFSVQQLLDLQPTALAYNVEPTGYSSTKSYMYCGSPQMSRSGRSAQCAWWSTGTMYEDAAGFRHGDSFFPFRCHHGSSSVTQSTVQSTEKGRPERRRRPTDRQLRRLSRKKSMSSRAGSLLLILAACATAFDGELFRPFSGGCAFKATHRPFDNPCSLENRTAVVRMEAFEVEDGLHEKKRFPTASNAGLTQAPDGRRKSGRSTGARTLRPRRKGQMLPPEQPATAKA